MNDPSVQGPHPHAPGGPPLDLVARGDPFELLGIRGDALDEASITQALRARLAALSQHLFRDTPAAQEYVLALHAAAAALLDAGMRATLSHGPARSAGETRTAAGRAESPTNPGQHAAPAPQAGASEPEQPREAPSVQILAEHAALARDLAIVLPLHGGWNSGAMAHALALAHARRLTADDVAHVLQNLSLMLWATVPSSATPATAHAPAAVHGPARSQDSAAAPTARATPFRKGDIFDRPLPEELEQADAQPARWRALLIAGLTLVLAVALTVSTLILGAARGWFASSPEPAPDVGPSGVSTAVRPTVPSTRGEGQGASPAGDPGPAPEPGDAGPGPKPDATASTTRDALQRAMRDVRASATSAMADPGGAQATLEAALDTLAAGWLVLEPAQRAQVQSDVLDAFYAGSAIPSWRERIIQRIALPGKAALERSIEPASIAPAVWSAGLASRLSRERELSLAERAACEEALPVASGGMLPSAKRTFATGARSMLAVLPTRIVQARPGLNDRSFVECWDRLARVTSDGFGSEDESLVRDLALIDAAEAVLLMPGPASEDDAARATLEKLVPLIDWRDSGQGRPRMLLWLTDRRLDAGDVRAATTVLASKSSAEGVDATMVLASDASAADRAALRDRYARAWKLATGSDGGVAARWQSAADALLADAQSVRSAEGALAAAVAHARVSEAAHRAHIGQGELAAALLEDHRQGVWPFEPADRALTPDLGMPTATTPGSDWARRYISAARSSPLRLSLLDDLLVSAIPDWSACDLVAREAMFGAPADVRQRAVDVVQRHASLPGMINALLELAPRLGPTSARSDLIARVTLRTLPPIESPEWPIAVRRVLVDRLLEQLATSSEGRTDELADQLARAYASLASDSVDAVATAAPGSTPALRLQAAADAVLARWTQSALQGRPALGLAISPAEVERRRESRVWLAEGLVQRFAAEQVCAMEMLACVVAGERPAMVARVQSALDECERERRQAPHVLFQMLAVERANVELWRIRLGLEPSSLDPAPGDQSVPVPAPTSKPSAPREPTG